MALAHVRHGKGAVRPYLHGPADLPAFVQEVFEAVALERHELGPRSFHVEMQVGGNTWWIATYRGR